MTRVCYWCNKYMGEKYDDPRIGVFYNVCDECALKFKLDERLPELLWAIAALRRQNGSKEQDGTLGILTAG